MGTRSYIVSQEGCEIDSDKFDNLLLLNKITGEDFSTSLSGKEIKEKGLGVCLDGWKIQGYWYSSFIALLRGVILPSMINLTNKPDDNYLYFAVEDNSFFVIRFFINEDTDERDLDVLIRNTEYKLFKTTKDGDLEYIENYGEW
jgi:hypothetical protein